MSGKSIIPTAFLHIRITDDDGVEHRLALVLRVQIEGRTYGSFVKATEGQTMTSGSLYLVLEILSQDEEGLHLGDVEDRAIVSAVRMKTIQIVFMEGRVPSVADA